MAYIAMCIIAEQWRTY